MNLKYGDKIQVTLFSDGTERVFNRTFISMHPNHPSLVVYSNGMKVAYTCELSQVKKALPSRFLNVYVGLQKAIRAEWRDSLVTAKYAKAIGAIGYLEDKQDGSTPIFHWY